MRKLTKLLAIFVVVPMVVAMAATPASAGFYIDCDKEQALHVDKTTGTFTAYPTIQEAIDAAQGDAAGSSSGDTVIVCHGTYEENIVIGEVDDPETDDVNEADLKANITVRSWDGPHETTIIGDLTAADAVVTINANGTLFGGSGLGFEILATGTPVAGETKAGVQVGTVRPVDLEEDDDQEVLECIPPTAAGDCPDDEVPALNPNNVSVIGNEIGDLVGSGNGNVAGIQVNNSNNTLVFRNVVRKLGANGAGVAYGIRYTNTNSNVEVLQNVVKELKQLGTACGDSSLANPTVGAVGISAEEEALDALFFNNAIEKIEANCTAIGAYSSAFGGLENDRNGQQIPIVTDVVDNKIKEIEGAVGNTAGIALAPLTQTNPEGPGPDPDPADGEEVAPPTSVRVSTNDIDKTEVGVAVLTQLAAYSYIEQNNFDHNMIGVVNSGSMNLDATNNWWGCDKGPESGEPECATISTTAPGTTSYHPYLKHHIDHAGSHAGDHAGDH